MLHLMINPSLINQKKKEKKKRTMDIALIYQLGQLFKSA